jgi:hypothetical protein
MVGAAGHDTSWDVFDKLFFLSIIPSIVLLTIYHNASISTAAKQLLRHSLIILLAFHVIVECYGLFQAFAAKEYIAVLGTLLFGLFSIAVLLGLLKQEL